MSDHEIEILKLKMQAEMDREARQERRERERADLFKWAVAVVWPLVVNVVTAYMATLGISTKVDEVKTAAVETAGEVKSELETATKKQEGRLTELATKQDAIIGGVDATVKSWKAFQSKQPEDMNTATEAVAKAERMTELQPASQPPEP